MADEIVAPPDSWELADLDVSVSRLMISPSERPDPSLGFVDDDLAITPTSSGYATAATASPSSSGAAAVTASGGSLGDVSSDDLVGQVDQFLREALEKPRERLSILRMEQDIENFLHDSRQQQIEFEALPTSYLRLAAHRVAQHYSLQSIAMPENTTLDGSCSKIVLLKTAKTHFPSVRLADIPVNLPQEEKNKIVKFAIKQRSDRNSQGISSNSNASKANQPKSVEERKEEYNRARARIFSGNNVGVKSDNEPSISDSFHHFSPVLRQSDIGLSESPDTNARRHVGESSSNNIRSGRTRMEATVARNEPTSIRQKATGKVAILRDRDVDRKDPDYDRSYDRYMQRFDPGFGFNVGTYTMQPLYSPVANYNTEFPQLGSGQRPQITMDHHARQMPHHLHHPSWGTSSSPTAHVYGPPEGIMSPFNANHVPVHTTSPIYLPPQYMSTPRPGMTYINPLEHLQPFAQTHQQQTDANFGLARPR